MAVHDSDLGKKLCEVLGLDPKKTVDIFISNKVNDLVRIDVKMIMQDDEGERLIELLKHYKLESLTKEDEKDVDVARVVINQLK